MNAENMKQWLESFKGLDPKNIPDWPLIPKLAVMVLTAVAVLAAGFFLDIQPKRTQLQQFQAKELELRATYKEKYTQAVLLPDYKKQLADTEVAFSSLLKQLPNKSEMASLLKEVNQSGQGRGLRFELFKPSATEIVKDYYAELPVQIRLLGDYHSLAIFASDAASLSRIINMSDIKISQKDKAKIIRGAKKDPQALLVLEATASTYRYLDKEELAAAEAAKKAEAQSKKGKGGKK